MTVLVRAFVRGTGFLCGGVVFAVLRAILAALHVGHPVRPVPEAVGTAVRHWLPELDVRRVRILDEANLTPLRWVGQDPLAIAIGYTLYFRGPLEPWSAAGRTLLAHELFHVEQVRRLGDRELLFGARYGEAYARCGFDYESNDFEIAARDFERTFSAGEAPERIARTASPRPAGPATGSSDPRDVST